MKFYFEEAEIWEHTKQSMFDEINKMGLPLVIAGRSSATSPTFLCSIHVPVEYVTSNSQNTWGKKYWGKEVVSPDDIPEKYDAYNVLIVTELYQKVLAEQFEKLSVPPQKIYHLEMKYEGNTAELYRARQSEIEAIYDRLADQQSKDTYETMIRYRINRDPALPARVALPWEEQYFPDSLGGLPFLHDSEVFVDVGAYTGDTAIAFNEAVHSKYKHIFSWEPDEINYTRLLQTAERLSNMTCWKYGAGEKTAQLRFSSKNAGAHISDTGEMVIFVEALDNLLNGVPVTYVKMDIEGMECPALRGAKRLIQKYMPKLAICTYHSDEDMIDVPQLILGLNPDYKLFMRQYTQSITDMVCYAI